MQILPEDICKYARENGWIEIEAVSNSLRVFKNEVPGFKYHQIIIPIDINDLDYPDCLCVAINTFAKTQDCSPYSIRAALYNMVVNS